MPAKLVVADPLPGNAQILPRSEHVRDHYVTTAKKQQKKTTQKAKRLKYR